jgi:hypothetical protein
MKITWAIQCHEWQTVLNELRLWFKRPDAINVTHEDLRYHNICARWVAKQLTDEHRHMWKGARNFWSNKVKD